MAGGQLRIIGGKWRGRRLHFPDAQSLRPTPDRVRETLFNWLQPCIGHSRCLDLFAGSGALGFEAASRGAREVVMVESNGRVAAALKQNCELLGAESIRVMPQDALAFLRSPAMPPFDIVFLDPPYASGLLLPCIQDLEAGGWLTSGGYVYLETAASRGLPPLPEGWEPLRSKKAGQVSYHLIRCSFERDANAD